MKNVLIMSDLLRRKEMKKMLVFLCAMVLGFGIIGSTPAGAVSMQPKGLPLCGGSWDQSWDVPGGFGNISEIEVFITSGNTDLGDPPLWGFSAGDWVSSLENPDYGLATGLPTTGIGFYTAFTADIGTPFTLDILLWNNNQLISGSAWRWDGSLMVMNETLSLEISPEGYNRNAQFPVPEPATMLLLGSGLIGLAALGRKKLFK